MTTRNTFERYTYPCIDCGFVYETQTEQERCIEGHDPAPVGITPTTIGYPLPFGWSAVIVAKGGYWLRSDEGAWVRQANTVAPAHFDDIPSALSYILGAEHDSGNPAAHDAAFAWLLAWLEEAGPVNALATTGPDGNDLAIIEAARRPGDIASADWLFLVHPGRIVQRRRCGSTVGCDLDAGPTDWDYCDPHAAAYRADYGHEPADI